MKNLGKLLVAVYCCEKDSIEVRQLCCPTLYSFASFTATRTKCLSILDRMAAVGELFSQKTQKGFQI
jgi:hypothetical protein